MKIRITGSTGLVGREIGKALASDGHQIIVISRNKERAKQLLDFPIISIEGDLSKNVVTNPILDSLDAVIHLMGEPVADGRWSEEKKEALMSSRIDATKNLFASIKTVSTVISASAIGYYGNRADEELSEESKAGEGFLAQLCNHWENEALTFEQKGARVALMRFGIVLSKAGGALPKMLIPFRLGFGGKLGTGQQWMSWIHINDLCSSILFTLNNKGLRGPINITSPNPIRNSDFTKQLAQALHRPYFLPAPQFGIKLLFGEKSEILLSSQKVKPHKLLDAGFKFNYATLKDALRNLL